MPLHVNGQTVPALPGQTLLELLTQLHLQPDTVVVERNRDIVPGDLFATTILEDEDCLEIVSFVGGG